ncbi:TetR/AcrR family transcriptional regulator [Metasolibacillus sp.]|uniref:TetR/AcrR family transcriptional regulator n=1 Tax=Metasolibacillus sp. TaxID=2703680 RepID=UPI0025D2F39F|nr:TetR/AcrR family transcriptional regulator [Metasolibacillus sp.]MCT6925567.1 TetR/AcrR family transcriptional regulator [Metasolibacillus sp.]MCT6941819.1 TetR/AcrR family transcriptional regulator [Metasolibacillus sp.]
MKTHSVQAERTKQFLKKSFIKLVHEKGYNAVTVKDIVTDAGYNRTTFYLHYQDKQDLVEELMQEMEALIQHYSMCKYKKDTPIDVMKMNNLSFDLFYFIYDHRDYFSLLLVMDTLPGIHRQLPDRLYYMFLHHFQFKYNNANTDDQHQKRYMAYGTAGVIQDWIESGFISSPAEMTMKVTSILGTFAKYFTIHYDDAQCT